MSYALALAPDAALQWRALDVKIQELVLDELDRIAEESLESIHNEFVRDVAHAIGNHTHYLFLHLLIEKKTATLFVLGVGHWSRPTI